MKMYLKCAGFHELNLIIFVNLHEVWHFLGELDDFFNCGRELGGEFCPDLFGVFDAQGEFALGLVVVRLRRRNEINNLFVFLWFSYVNLNLRF